MDDFDADAQVKASVEFISVNLCKPPITDTGILHSFIDKAIPLRDNE